MNELQIFSNEEFGEIRTIQIKGEPWFMLADVCRILGIRNSRDAKTRLNEKGVGNTDIGVQTGLKKDGTPSMQNVQADFINESNLYKLIFQSRKPQAEKFSDWVTSEVLPSIRKHGAYMTPQKLEEVLLNPDTLIKLATDLKAEREKRIALETTNAIQQQQIAEMNPKATYYDLVLQCPDLLSATEIAKDYGKSAKWLNKILSDNKIQFKQRGIWFLYSKYAEQGYTSTKTQSFVDKDSIVHTKTHTYWTQKGRLFIYDFLKKLGYFPVIEQQQKGA